MKKYDRMAEVQQCDLTVALYGYVESPYCPTSFPHAQMSRLSHSRDVGAPGPLGIAAPCLRSRRGGP